MQLELTLNGEETTFEVERSALLLDVLREHGYTGAKRGCDTGACGACNVIVDGEVRQSCVTPAARVEGADVETIEGLGTQDDLHPVQAAFVANNATQCGYCIPGMIMSAKALVDENPDPTEAEVRSAIAGNLCRCTGYKKPVEAVLDAAETVREGDGVAADGGRAAGGAEGVNAGVEVAGGGESGGPSCAGTTERGDDDTDPDGGGATDGTDPEVAADE